MGAFRQRRNESRKVVTKSLVGMKERKGLGWGVRGRREWEHTSEGCAHAWAEALDPELASQHFAEGSAGATEQT